MRPPKAQSATSAPPRRFKHFNMTEAVIDASVLVIALADRGPDGTTARALLRGRNLSALELIDLEVASVLRRLVMNSALDLRAAERALRHLAAIPIRRVPHTPLLSRIWQLRDNLTVYDAAYVALAELLNCSLITADARLVRSPGIACHMELLEEAVTNRH